jgi:hypothetical protein
LERKDGELKKVKSKKIVIGIDWRLWAVGFRFWRTKQLGLVLEVSILPIKVFIKVTG